MNCILYLQFIALGTGDGTIKLLDHTGTTLMDRIYTLVGARFDTLCCAMKLVNSSRGYYGLKSRQEQAYFKLKRALNVQVGC